MSKYVKCPRVGPKFRRMGFSYRLNVCAPRNLYVVTLTSYVMVLQVAPLGSNRFNLLPNAGGTPIIELVL